MGLIQRRGDLPLNAFRLHWRTIHRGLALRLAEAGLLRGYVQNHRLALDAPGLRVVADGVPELWFDGPDVFGTMRTHPAFRDGVFHDEPNFMDVGDYRSQPLGEEAGEGASRAECVGLLKLIRFARSGEPAFAADGAVRRAVHRRPSDELPIKVAPYDRVETSWWPDLASFAAAWRLAGIEADGLLAEERPVFWPGDPIPPAD